MSRRARVIVGLLVLVGVVALGRVLPLASWAAGAAAWARGLGPAGMVAYVGLYAGTTMAMLPGSPLTVAAGAAWGPWVGFAVVWPGAVLGAQGAFVLGRTVLRERVQARIDADPRWTALDRAVGEQGGRLVFLLRLSPLVPFNLLNPGLGATRVSAPVHLVATAVGILPGTLLYVLAGAALGDLGAVAAGRAPRTGTEGLVLTAVGVLATLAVTVWITRTARRALAEVLPDQALDDGD